MSDLHFDLHSAAVLAPGLESLERLREACRGPGAEIPFAPVSLPSPAVLPANERRRSSQAVRLVLACIEQALQDCPFAPDALRSVFATDEGTGEVCQQMLDTLATTRQVSPLLFPNSVHNAPSGYFSIGWRNRQPATVVSMGLESFASGLLCAVTEARATGQPVLLAAYDAAISAPLDELLPVRESTCTVWIVSSRAAGEGVPVLASFTLALDLPGAKSPSARPAWLPARWDAHSSAKALAALGLLEAEAGTEYRLALGAQLVTLRRTAAVHP